MEVPSYLVIRIKEGERERIYNIYLPLLRILRMKRNLTHSCKTSNEVFLPKIYLKTLEINF